MDGLRWLLLVAGILVIIGIYFYSRKQASEQEENDVRLEPTLDDSAPLPQPAAEPDYDAVESVYTDEPDEEEEPDDSDDGPDEQKIVTMRIVARNRGAFKGDDLILALRGLGMRHGKFGIFHRIDGDDEEATIFSAASLIEPGSFDLANIKEQEIPGISLFLVLPGPIDGAEAFDMMMESARTITQGLDGELLDESGSSLSIQRERYLREEIIQFEHSVKVA